MQRGLKFSKRKRTSWNDVMAEVGRRSGRSFPRLRRLPSPSPRPPSSSASVLSCFSFWHRGGLWNGSTGGGSTGGRRGTWRRHDIWIDGKGPWVQWACVESLAVADHRRAQGFAHLDHVPLTQLVRLCRAEIVEAPWRELVEMLWRAARVRGKVKRKAGPLIGRCSVLGRVWTGTV